MLHGMIGTERDSGESAFQAITMMAGFCAASAVRSSVVECEGARYADDSLDNLQAKTRIKSFNLRV